jgi:hypothetical protein
MSAFGGSTWVCSVLISNIRIGWNGLALAQTLSYNTEALITTVKSFTVKAPETVLTTLYVLHSLRMAQEANVTLQ